MISMHITIEAEPEQIMEMLRLLKYAGVVTDSEILPPVTQLELEILKLYKTGLTVKEIGHRLGYSVSRINKFLNQLHRIFGVNTWDLIRAGMRDGWL